MISSLFSHWPLRLTLANELGLYFVWSMNPPLLWCPLSPNSLPDMMNGACSIKLCPAHGGMGTWHWVMAVARVDLPGKVGKMWRLKHGVGSRICRGKRKVVRSTCHMAPTQPLTTPCLEWKGPFVWSHNGLALSYQVQLAYLVLFSFIFLLAQLRKNNPLKT